MSVTENPEKQRQITGSVFLREIIFEKGHSNANKNTTLPLTQQRVRT